MRLKRIFPKGVEVRQKRDADGKVMTDQQDRPIREEVFEECVVRIQRLSPRWHVSPRIVEKGIGEGWMSASKGTLTLHTEVGADDVVYEILARPSREERRNYYDCKVVNHA